MRHEHAPINIDGQSLITPSLIQKYNAAHKTTSSVSTRVLQDAAAELLLVLEMAQQGFEGGQPTDGVMERLITRLHVLRHKNDVAVWDELARIAREHPVKDYILQDPFTRWSHDKPRGYSGDAGLIDLIYQHESKDRLVAEATDLGRAIYDKTIVSEACIAVRERRDILARLVDETATRTGSAEILSVACGHLRESAQVKALTEGKIKRWIALDQDEASLEEVKKTSLQYPVIEPNKGNVAGLIRRSYKIGTFDFVYAAGLYDYLSREVSIRLTQRLMEMVKPGGEMLFANFSDETLTDGYMESFMNWPLILRTRDDMMNIINASVDRNKVDVDLFLSENRFIYYARLRKKAD